MQRVQGERLIDILPIHGAQRSIDGFAIELDRCRHQDAQLHQEKHGESAESYLQCEKTLSGCECVFHDHIITFFDDEEHISFWEEF
jgi:hypothetical protein